MTKLPTATGIFVWAVTLVVWIISGGSFVAFRLGVATIPPFTMVAFRLLVAGCVLVALSRWIDRDVTPAEDPLEPKQITLIFVAAVLTFTLGQGLVVWGVSRTGAGVGSVLAASSPVFLGLFAWLFRIETLTPRQWIGIAIGFVGCASLLTMRNGGVFSIDSWAGAALLIGPAAFAAGLLMQKHTPLPKRKFLATGVQMVIAAIVLLLVAGAAGELSSLQLDNVSPSSWLALAYITIPGSLIVFALIIWLARTTSPAIANSFAYASPAISIVLSRVILSEPITSGLLASAALAFGGAALMVQRES